MAIVYLRAETKAFEKRTPLIPDHAAQLVRCGHQVVVEQCQQRIFNDQLYRQVGCQLVSAGSWQQAPNDAIILGIKELPAADFPLHHTHIYFAHAFKGQDGAAALLQRFADGKGKLYDLEFLTDEHHRRIASFGVSAGNAGAIAALLLWAQQQQGVSPPFGLASYYDSSSEALAAVQQQLNGAVPKLLIIGAYGRCGRGVRSIIRELGLPADYWGQKDTTDGGPFTAIADYDICFNCVYLRKPMPPFLTLKELEQRHRLRLLADISCDPNNSNNPFPIYSHITSFDQPTCRVETAADHFVDVMAIDHLPSLLPKESSRDFSIHLLKHFEEFLAGDVTTPWQHAAEIFMKKLAELTD